MDDLDIPDFSVGGELENNEIVFEAADPPCYLKTLLSQKLIRNVDAITLFDMFHETAIPLNTLDLYCYGIKDRKKHVVNLQIVKCEHTPLKGAHLIRYRNQHHIVPCLKVFKRKMGFTDKISFDRSTFFLQVFQGKEVCVRLSSVNYLLQLPTMGSCKTVDGALAQDAPLSKVTPFINIPSFRHHVIEGDVTNIMLLYNHVIHAFLRLHLHAGRDMSEVTLKELEKIVQSS